MGTGIFTHPNLVPTLVVGMAEILFLINMSLESMEIPCFCSHGIIILSSKTANLVHLVSLYKVSPKEFHLHAPHLLSFLIQGTHGGICNDVHQHHHLKQRDYKWWMVMEDDSSSSLGDSNGSKGSSSSTSDMVDDASSSLSCSSTNSNSGPLYELSELMAQLPIKRGLSKFFQGKSQSFTSLSRVKSIKDLAKKETPLGKKMKACKSYGFGLDSHKLYTLPRATISKKVSRGSLSLQGRRSAGCFSSSRPPPIPVEKNFRSINS